jgi:hypothetical protein
MNAYATVSHTWNLPLSLCRSECTADSTCDLFVIEGDACKLAYFSPYNANEAQNPSIGSTWEIEITTKDNTQVSCNWMAKDDSSILFHLRFEGHLVIVDSLVNTDKYKIPLGWGWYNYFWFDHENISGARGPIVKASVTVNSRTIDITVEKEDKITRHSHKYPHRIPFTEFNGEVKCQVPSWKVKHIPATVGAALKLESP